MNENKKNILVTSALPYVNNVPHLGNIIGCVLSADVWSRYSKAIGNNVLFVCGTDEYGTATETKARQENLTEQEICDKYNKIHKQVYEWFNIEFDYFGRTTSDKQTEIAQNIFKKIAARGLLIEKSTQQYFCPKLNTFLADRYIAGKCPFCGAEDANGDQCDSCGKLIDPIQLINPYCKSNPDYKLELRTTEHLYLDLPKLQTQLKLWIDSSKDNWSKTASDITEAWIEKELKPRCITRDLKWGVSVPNTPEFGDKYKNKVFYVWFDAPIGYISITANATDEWEDWWKKNTNFGTEYVQFMAKDNVPFHSIIFPATLIASYDNYKLVNKIAAVEYLNYQDTKFSKSKGVGVFGDTIQNSGIEPDIWRFYLIYIRPESSDSSFIWDDFQDRVNNELINNLGNLFNRVLTFTSKKFNGIINKIDHQDDNINNIINEINNLSEQYLKNMKETKLRDALKNTILIGKVGNKLMQDYEPWKLFKTDYQKCQSILYVLLSIINHLKSLIGPFMPNVQEKICKYLNSNDISINKTINLEISEYLIIKPNILFEKITDEKIKEMKNKFK